MSLPFAYGGPALSGLLKSEPEDFEVDEQLGFEADGQGEHDLVRIEKRACNTHWVADQLAKFAKVAPLAVGFAGLKDRQAVATQHFTVQLPGRHVDWAELQLPGVRLISVARHSRKLKRGALTGNRFMLRIREVDGDRARAAQMLERLATSGAPNYFGEQRFGHQGGNLNQARRLFAGARLDRQQRGFALSAARSEIFNQVLAMRVRQRSWDTVMAGEICVLDGKRTYFGPVSADDFAVTDDAEASLIHARCRRGEIHPSGPLWGRGRLPTADECAQLELSVADAHRVFTEGLERAGLDQERRALRVSVADLSFEWPTEHELKLRFALPAGAYATAFVRELLALRLVPPGDMDSVVSDGDFG